MSLELSLVTRQLFLSSFPGKQLENYLGHRNAELLLLSSLILLPDKKWEWLEKDLIWRRFTLFLYFFVPNIFVLGGRVFSPWNPCCLSSHSCSPLLIMVACERDNVWLSFLWSSQESGCCELYQKLWGIRRETLVQLFQE